MQPAPESVSSFAALLSLQTMIGRIRWGGQAEVDGERVDLARAAYTPRPCFTSGHL